MSDLTFFIQVYACYITIFILLCKSRYKLIFAGIFTGYTIWLYDWDFCLNFGGPSTPITDYICGFLGLQRCRCLNPEMFLPFLVLIVAGGIAGFLLWFPLTIKRRIDNEN